MQANRKTKESVGQASQGCSSLLCLWGRLQIAGADKQGWTRWVSDALGEGSLALPVRYASACWGLDCVLPFSGGCYPQCHRGHCHNHSVLFLPTYAHSCCVYQALELLLGNRADSHCLPPFSPSSSSLFLLLLSFPPHFAPSAHSVFPHPL